MYTIFLELSIWINTYSITVPHLVWYCFYNLQFICNLNEIQKSNFCIRCSHKNPYPYFHRYYPLIIEVCNRHETFNVVIAESRVEIIPDEYKRKYNPFKSNEKFIRTNICFPKIDTLQSETTLILLQGHFNQRMYHVAMQATWESLTTTG